MYRPTLLLVILAATAIGCQSTDVGPDSETALNRSDAGEPKGDPAVGQAATEVRRLTAAYRNRLDLAIQAGYSTQITDCMSNGAIGAMGFHFGNGGLIDATVELAQPEALLYEPGRGGTRELVGVEYLVPLAAWSQPDPPSLLGVRFKRNDVFQVWALHFWIWRKNPTGIFSDWNPRVSCEAAPSTQVHQH